MSEKLKLLSLSEKYAVVIAQIEEIKKVSQELGVSEEILAWLVLTARKMRSQCTMIQRATSDVSTTPTGTNPPA